MKDDGLLGFIGKLLKYLKSITLDRLDALLFKKNAWAVVRPWMLYRCYYGIIKLLGFREGEHQLGRLKNMDDIFKNIKKNGYTGDIVEFGSYRGFSLYWLARFRKKYGLNNKIIGIDSFEGLPETSSVWKKGMFDDTDYDTAFNNIKKYLDVHNLEENNIFIIKGLFGDPNVRERLRDLSDKILLAHIDCDLGSSCTCALEIVDKMHKNDPFYLLFDDWGNHPDEIPKSFSAFMNARHEQVEGTLISSTNLTRYFLISKAGKAPVGIQAIN